MSTTGDPICTCKNQPTAGRIWCPIHDNYAGLPPSSPPAPEQDPQVEQGPERMVIYRGDRVEWWELKCGITEPNEDDLAQAREDLKRAGYGRVPKPEIIGVEQPEPVPVWGVERRLKVEGGWEAWRVIGCQMVYPTERDLRIRTPASLDGECEVRAVPLFTYPTEPDTRLRGAIEEITQLAWAGCDIDGGDFHDIMVKHGLFVEVPADQAFKDEWDSDTMFVLAWKPRRTALDT